jgi:hypothetical protein
MTPTDQSMPESLEEVIDLDDPPRTLVDPVGFPCGSLPDAYVAIVWGR